LKKIIILTSHELRHKFFGYYLNTQRGIKLLYVVHEKMNKLSENKKFQNSNIFKKHINHRKISEKKYFSKYKNKYNSMFVKKGAVNEAAFIEKIRSDNPDYIVTFGCSILKENFIKNFKNKTINIHLGLSPYYRGSGTNFFPFVNEELQFLGSTIMKISKKIDGGDIISQVRPKIYSSDKIHDIGNRIILKTAKVIKKIILSKKIVSHKKRANKKSRYFKREDFTVEVLKKAINNLKLGAVDSYLKNENQLKKKYPIIIKY
jgi:phosphoribosylglycinamide formyltransferase 1